MLIALVEEKSSKLLTLSGKGMLSFESPEMAGTASFTSSLRRPDSLLVFLEGPFGINVGTLFLSKERYIVYNSLENRVMTGVPSSQAIRTVIPFDLTFDQIINAFAGVFTFPPAASAGTLAVDGDQFLLSYPCGSSVCSYWIDPTYLLVTRFEQRGTDGEVIVEANCSSPVEEGDAVSAQRIVVKFPQDQKRLSISYSSLSLNVIDPSFVFSIPKNAQTTER